MLPEGAIRNSYVDGMTNPGPHGALEMGVSCSVVLRFLGVVTVPMAVIGTDAGITETLVHMLLPPASN